MPIQLFNTEEIKLLEESRILEEILGQAGLSKKKLKKTLLFMQEMIRLQIELAKLQEYIRKSGQRIVILFEGRDAAGKGGTIKRFNEYLNPRWAKIVALDKPNETDLQQWYFQRYVPHLPKKGEITFFDRSWYNRAVVEPVMGFCTHEQYEQFILSVPEFEKMITDDGIILIKFWFAIHQEEQKKRIEERKSNPLKRWKYSPVDEKAMGMWEEYTSYIQRMFIRTSVPENPWWIIHSNKKKHAQLASIRHVLSRFEYPNKEEVPKLFSNEEPIIQLFKDSLDEPITD